MKRKALAWMTALMLLLSFVPAGCSEQITVMATFYPFYIFTQNIFAGVEQIHVACMTAPQTGCLHDYQLLTTDLMKLEQADLLILCGGGMEHFIQRVIDQYPALPLVDCSEGLDLILEEDGETNAHTWLDPRNAMQIVQTIANAAVERYPFCAEQILQNTADYLLRLQQVDTAIRELLSPCAGRGIVTFHEAFPYFARAYDLHIVAVISQEPDQPLSPSELTRVIQLVRQNNCPPLFVEAQYMHAQDVSATIAQETGARIWSLDPVVTGGGELDHYERAMLQNAQTVLQSLTETEEVAP